MPKVAKRIAANKEKIDQLTAPLRNRELWLELLKAVNDCLPREIGNEKDVAETTLRKQLHIESFVQKKVENVSEWHTALVDANKKEDFHEDDQEDGFDSSKHDLAVLVIVG